MSTDSSTICGYPVSALLLRLRYGSGFLIVFYSLYGLSSILVAEHAHRYEIAFEWERLVPFMPEAAWLYNSLALLMLTTVLLVRRNQDIHRLFLILCVQVIVACALFIIFPVEISFPDRYAENRLPLVFVLADLVNLENNYFPSLHVCFAFMSAMVAARYLTFIPALLALFWAVLIAVSTMLIHEHHFVDILGGILLASAGFIMFIRTRLEPN